MELPGAIPPDRDSHNSMSLQQSSTTNLNIISSLSGQHSLSVSSSIGVSAASGTTSNSSSSSSGNNSSSGNQQPFERLSRPMSFDKMECLVREMQDPEMGVPVRSQKLFLTSIPSAFMGYDLIEWMMERLTIEESEALSIANQLCLHGYFFPVNDCKTLLVKDDSSLYRFQTPYYWPWQHKAPDNVEYAIYLAKRSLRNKQRHGLEDYESEALTSLHKNLKAKWDVITLQAEEQVKLAKDRKKGDKIVGDSQERAYWRVHRPPPGQFTPLESCPIPSRDRQGKPRRRTVDDWQREVDYLKSSMGRTRMKMTQACECLIQYCETFSEYDFFIQPVLPSNPWVSEDITFWQLNGEKVDIPTEKRVKRWAISIEELVSDPTGLHEFTLYLKKEYSHENIRFWIAVNDLRRSAHSQISKKVKDIYEEFLEPGAPCEINIDGKTMEKVQNGLKSPCRFTFDAAAEHIYALLLKKDCYPRFVRSEHYKSLLATGIQPSHKKRFFGFGVPKKKSSTAPPIPALLSQGPSTSIVPPPGSLARRRGSDRSLTGSAHELAVSGVKDGSSKVPHSHSQSNLSEIPYSVVIYRGDMPSCGGVSATTTTTNNTTIIITTTQTQEDLSSLIQSACSITTATGTAVVVAPTEGHIRIQDANFNKYQSEPTKTMGEMLETTAETAPPITGGSIVCAVCPWDMPETCETESTTTIVPPPTNTVQATAVSLSVCPWENEVELPSHNTAETTFLSSNNQQQLSRNKNNSAIDSGSSSSDVSDISDRMRRSCGIRQNTLDCDLYGSKRLLPSGGEQHRRASMTIAPRLSDLQFGLRQQQSLCESTILPPNSTISPVTVTVQSPSSSTITVAKRDHPPPLSAAQLTLNLINTTTTATNINIDERDDVIQLPATISEEFTPEQPCSTIITTTTNNTIITTTTTTTSVAAGGANTATLVNPSKNSNERLVDEANLIISQEKTIFINLNEKSEIKQVKINDSVNNITSTITQEQQQQQHPQPSLSSTVSIQQQDPSSAISYTSPDSITPFGRTPTINVVCPIGEENSISPTFDGGVATNNNDGGGNNIKSMDIDDHQHQSSTISSSSSTPSVSQLPSPMPSINSNFPTPIATEQPTTLLISLSPTKTTTPTTELHHQLNVHTYDGLSGGGGGSGGSGGHQEELSPTTDEYQECCPPDDYQYDISTDGDILAPGCVAPAPTPAPSIAPLAEVEIDPTDDDPDTEETGNRFGDIGDGDIIIEEGQSSIPCGSSMSSPPAHGIASTITTAGGEITKKKRRKRRESESKLDKESLSQESIVTPQSADDQHGRNTVCPWEDDDVSSTADAPFVKTYATLGYL